MAPQVLQQTLYNQGHVHPPHCPFHLFPGLDQVKDLTRRTIERIIRLAPFHSLDDFLSRVDPRPQEAINLARVGGLEGFGTIPSILRRLESGWRVSQMSLFRRDSGDEEDWTLTQKVDAQVELLGASLDAHPLELVSERISASGAVQLWMRLEE